MVAVVDQSGHKALHAGEVALDSLPLGGRCSLERLEVQTLQGVDRVALGRGDGVNHHGHDGGGRLSGVGRARNNLGHLRGHTF